LLLVLLLVIAGIIKISPQVKIAKRIQNAQPIQPRFFVLTFVMGKYPIFVLPQREQRITILQNR